MKIIIDALGGDFAPQEAILGGILALKEKEDFDIVFCGDKPFIEGFLINENEKILKRIQIIDAPEKIENSESPTEAVKNKVNSSIVKAIEQLRKDEKAIAFISAGSTGALLTGSLLKLGRFKGVSRPALAPLIPTVKRGSVMLIDCGANMDCKPINLCHFALLGTAYMKAICGIENPRVALLNVGVEDKKGNELCRTVFPMLQKMEINFVGNMEARDMCSGDYDVVVSDGYSGNILLKGTEGAINLVTSELKKNIKSSFITKIGGLFCKKAFKQLKNKLSLSSQGGSVFLGCKKTVIKVHGSSKANSFKIAVFQAIELEKCNFNNRLMEELAKMPSNGIFEEML